MVVAKAPAATVLIGGSQGRCCVIYHRWVLSPQIYKLIACGLWLGIYWAITTILRLTITWWDESESRVVMTYKLEQVLISWRHGWYQGLFVTILECRNIHCCQTWPYCVVQPSCMVVPHNTVMKQHARLVSAPRIGTAPSSARTLRTCYTVTINAYTTNLFHEILPEPQYAISNQFHNCRSEQ